MQNKTIKSGAGFTLVELLVVIAIIGILSTVAVVNLNSARDKAKVSAALALAKSYESPAVFCDNQDGIINNYSAGAAFCSVDIGVNWPTSLPENYEVIGKVDDTAGDGVWIYFIVDSAVEPLPFIRCDNASGCNSQ